MVGQMAELMVGMKGLQKVVWLVDLLADELVSGLVVDLVLTLVDRLVVMMA